jgi:teichuronic acid biosynthesis glycosyltransferase TuaC
MKLLFVSNLFPDRDEPVRGLDNATLLHELRQGHGHEVRVIALRPTLLPGLVRHRRRHLHCRPGDETLRPSYLRTGYVPRLGSRWNDLLVARALRPSFEETIKEFSPDLVLAAWLFPDGCAVASLCREAELPLVLITQGSDTHQYLTNPIRRQKIVSAIESSEAVICRSGDLAGRLEAAGVAPEKLRVIYNGVDPETFFAGDRTEARQALGLQEEAPSLLFVGNLLPVKDPLFLLRAHAGLNAARAELGLSRARLRLIGQGPLEGAMRREVRRLGSSTEVEFLGRRNPHEVARWMNTSDVFCLTSINEGFPNVLLEAMACRLPIVSTDVGGIREKINAPERGRLVPRGDLEGYVEALSTVLSAAGKPPATEEFTWAEAGSSYDECLKRALG